MTKSYFLPLFLPYFIGNHLSWLYYKRKLPLMSRVKEGVYFGRHPTFEEYTVLKEKNLNVVLDLALEHPKLLHVKFYRKRLPLLDQTIPNPKILHESVMFIEEQKKDGIYVHCALGLSRSVLVISAWLLYTGYSRDKVDELMREIRPRYIKSAYMGVALEIYEEWLTAHFK